MKRFLGTAGIVLVVLAPLAFGQSLDLAVNGYGLGLGNSRNITGIRLNLVDDEVENVRGLNLTLWKPNPSPEGRIQGISLGLIGFDAEEITGLTVAVVGMDAGRLRGVTIAGVGVDGQTIEGLLLTGIGAGAATVKGVSIAGIGVGAADVHRENRQAVAADDPK